MEAMVSFKVLFGHWFAGAESNKKKPVRIDDIRADNVTRKFSPFPICKAGV